MLSRNVVRQSPSTARSSRLLSHVPLPRQRTARCSSNTEVKWQEADQRLKRLVQTHRDSKDHISFGLKTVNERYVFTAITEDTTVPIPASFEGVEVERIVARFAAASELFNPQITPFYVNGVVDRHRPMLMQIPGVVMVGMGTSKELSRAVVVVYIENEEVAEKVPATLEDIPVMFVISGKFVAAVESPYLYKDRRTYWPLREGAGYVAFHKEQYYDMVGSMGCVVQKGGKPYVLSCAHAVLVPSEKIIGAPSLSVEFNSLDDSVVSFFPISAPSKVSYFERPPMGWLHKAILNENVDASLISLVDSPGVTHFSPPLLTGVIADTTRIPSGTNMKVIHGRTGGYTPVRKLTTQVQAPYELWGNTPNETKYVLRTENIVVERVTASTAPLFLPHEVIIDKKKKTGQFLSQGCAEPAVVSGDSGGIVVDEHDRLVGIIVADSCICGFQAVVLPFETIAKELGIEKVYTKSGFVDVLPPLGKL